MTYNYRKPLILVQRYGFLWTKGCVCLDIKW